MASILVAMPLCSSMDGQFLDLEVQWRTVEHGGWVEVVVYPRCFSEDNESINELIVRYLESAAFMSHLFLLFSSFCIRSVRFDGIAEGIRL